MTIPTQLVLEALVADPDRELYGVAGQPAQRHRAPDPRPARGGGLADVALGGHRPPGRGTPAAALLPAHRRRGSGGSRGADRRAPAGPGLLVGRAGGI